MTGRSAFESGGPEARISVRDLVVKYGDRVVLNKISLDVMAGETMVILGESGGGKSTFLKCLIGLKKPSSGKILIYGQDITKVSPEEFANIKKKFGVLFQSAALFNSMTVADNVALPLREHTRLDESVIDIMVKIKLELVGLTGAERLLPSQLSGGMRKRAGLARAMAMDPEILFFDEPSAGLDPRLAADIDSLILKLERAFHLTMVVVTHRIESAFAIADRVALIHGGDILFLGTPDEMRRSDNQIVRQFLEGAPHPEGEGRGDYLQDILRERGE
ncbi:MAG: ABC transporter ATP-binding protein [Candidatus Abyssobacteria bacterium SURF_5]|uniref:ABC transporter ATP-binding protein n=1 Tax=Abyssobacteria bacterium (strain SURF_5) TaxID=2093360 RepID=A0A3A4MVM7_ABYX5|nr:MAG: ABC transporter ATP-binding protein [Candidatus Abyssubacteria bacterium SURF_5]